MTKKKGLSKEDITTWNNYIKNPNDISDKEKNSEKTNFNKSRFIYDLHGYTLAEANLRVGELIFNCMEKDYKEILLITGKGIHSNTEKDVFVSKDLSKLKCSVPNYINTHNELSKCVISINDAKKEDGGEGAIIIKLRKL